jgi:hypothetical protein
VKVQIPLDTFQAIINVLAEMPYKQVFGLIQAINQQIIQIEDTHSSEPSEKQKQ